jgi:hypothetical protein
MVQFFLFDLKMNTCLVRIQYKNMLNLINGPDEQKNIRLKQTLLWDKPEWIMTLFLQNFLMNNLS